MDSFYYNTIEQSAMAEFKDRGSKFIAYSYPVNSIDQAKKFLAALKKEHPKAVHHCLAYRMGVDGSTFRVSDDGEPSGSAGRPILGQIDSKQLTNISSGSQIFWRYAFGRAWFNQCLQNSYFFGIAIISDDSKAYRDCLYFAF